jgi:Holliday junction resolvasome RuvABC endonuclease subunit
MRVLGVDPGAVSGAYALLGEHPKETHVGDVPVVDRQVNAAEWSRIVRYCSPDVVVIERVGAMPKQGVSSTFRFGMGAGLIRGVVAGASLPIVDAVPAVWKRHFKLDGDPERSRALAIRRFPKIEGLARKKDHNRADALLIAVWHLETRGDPV